MKETCFWNLILFTSYLDGFYLTIDGYKNELFQDQIIYESEEGGSILTGEYKTSLYELISRLNMYNLPIDYDSKNINEIYENSIDDVLFPNLNLYVNLPKPICIDHMTDRKLREMITNVRNNIEQGVEAMVSEIVIMTDSRRYSDLDSIKKQDNLLSLLGIKNYIFGELTYDRSYTQAHYTKGHILADYYRSWSRQQGQTYPRLYNR